jgi:hypothetical protein
MRVLRLVGWVLCAGAALAVPPGSHPVAVSAAAGAPLVFCADPGYMPYSDRSGDGFENRIAGVVGRALGRPERTLILGAKLFLTADDESASPQEIVDAVESNKIDVEMSWDPAVGYYLKKHPDLVAVAIPNERSQGYPEQYTFPRSMATRAAELDAVLRTYNINFTAPSADSGL